MAEVAGNKVYEITVRGVADGQAVNNVFHYITEEAIPVGTLPTEAEFLDTFRDRWQNCLGSFHDSYSVQEYFMKRANRAVFPGRRPGLITHVEYDNQEVITGDAADFGTLTGDVLPTYVAVGYKKVTTSVGRSWRGNMRVGPVIEAHVDVNLLNAAGRINWAESVFDPLKRILLPVTSFPMLLVVFSKHSSDQIGLTDNMRQYTRPVVRWRRNNYISSQVSRKRRASLGS
jgi:hypothetical protein